MLVLFCWWRFVYYTPSDRIEFGILYSSKTVGVWYNIQPYNIQQHSDGGNGIIYRENKIKLLLKFVLTIGKLHRIIILRNSQNERGLSMDKKELLRYAIKGIGTEISEYESKIEKGYAVIDKINRNIATETTKSREEILETIEKFKTVRDELRKKRDNLLFEDMMVEEDIKTQ